MHTVNSTHRTVKHIHFSSTTCCSLGSHQAASFTLSMNVQPYDAIFYTLSMTVQPYDAIF